MPSIALSHVLLLLSLVSVFVCYVSAGGPIVDLGYAQYQGSTDTTQNITSFLSIRYASPPIGDLRFRAPQPPQKVSGVQQATSQPQGCIQTGDGLSPTNPFEKRATTNPEDCLFLNVYMPSNATKALPVMVWIHGGGYVAGQASSFHGEDWIHESEHGVIAVVIQYRLGVVGFLPGAKVKEGGALNAGLLDQDFALRWVNQHIAKFGGNPEDVTIWGESAGAGSVLQHVVANGGRTQPQLFQKAISSSAFLPSQYGFNEDVPEFLYNRVVQLANCSGASDTLACLRTADISLLQAANSNISASAFFGTFAMVPVVDGTFITQRPTVSLTERRVNGKAIMVITNAREGLPFVSQTFTANQTASEYASLLFPHFTPQLAAEAGKQYANLGTDSQTAVTLHGEAIFICPSYLMLEAFTPISWKGEFDVDQASHGADVAYYWPTGNTPVLNNATLINAFSEPFFSFGRFGNPNAKFDPSITPQWNQWIEGETEMLFNNTGNVPVVKTITSDQKRLERCRFWQSVGAFTAQ